jgi:hypothetical protein
VTRLRGQTFRPVSVNVCQINQPCKQHNNNSLGSLYTAQLLARLSKEPVVGTRLETFLLLRNYPPVFTLDPYVLLLMNLETYDGVLISPQPEQEANKLQQPNS